MKLCTLQSFIFWEFANSSSLTWPAHTQNFSFSFLFFFTFQCQLTKGWSQGLTHKRTTSTSTFSAKVSLASVPSLPTQIARSLLVLQKKKQTNKKTKKKLLHLTLTMMWTSYLQFFFGLSYMSVEHKADQSVKPFYNKHWTNFQLVNRPLAFSMQTDINLTQLRCFHNRSCGLWTKSIFG